MSLNGILSSALSALQTNQAALRTVSNNVANINTDGYVRRVVDMQALVSGGQLTGVEVGDVQRVADQFLNQEVLYAQGSSTQYKTASDIFTQLNGLIGSPGDGNALTSQLEKAFSALGTAALSPTSSTSQSGALAGFQNLASTISSLSDSLSGLKSTVDQQVSASVGTVNTLIQQIYQFNSQIQTATAAGDNASGVLDQRDQAVQQLSQLIGVRTAENSNGQLAVMTDDGVSLVGDTYAQLSYTSGASNGTYGSISLSNLNPATGQVVGQPMTLDSHLGSGKIKGLIDMRDGALTDLQQELGTFAQTTAQAFNAQSNANASFPPPAKLAGRNTGLLSTDSLGFSGKTTIGVADSSGALVSRIDVDFGAGTLSVDGGAAVSIGSTVGSFVTALNSALGVNGTASFTDGQLSLSAAGTNGIVVQNDSGTPSSRGGSSFSQFFGLNDIFRSSSPTITATGLAAGDAAGFSAGDAMDFTLKGPNGEVAKTVSVTLTGTETIGTIVGDLNTAFGGAMTFSLGSGGTLTATPSAAYANYDLNVTKDTTSRGSTGMSFSQLFGLGTTQASAVAVGFSVNPAIESNPSMLPFAQTSIAATTVAGDTVVTSGDSRGLIALQNLASTKQSFAKAGLLSAQTATLGDYAASFYQSVSVASQTATNNATAQSDRLTEAQSRKSSVSGVNLDEELTNMMTYQQAYSASARILQTVQSLYDTLLQIQ